MKDKKYTRITESERFQIEVLLLKRTSIKEIAKLLNRPISTVFREIQRGKKVHGGKYIASTVHRDAKIRNRLKRIEPKIMLNDKLRFYIYRRLLLGWSPEQIANKVKLDYPLDPNMRISYESIYKWIYCQDNYLFRKKLITLLPYKKPKRAAGQKRHIYMGKIIDRTSINERPEHVDLREEPGHWEGDLIIGKGKDSAIGTLVERKTRYTIIIPLKSRESKHVVSLFAQELNKLPTVFRKSLTYDNGVEMSAHKTFTSMTKMPVFFTHPYSSWERGTNENTNGLIRRFFPKKTNFNHIDQDKIKEVQHLLNHRPRKVLDWRSPIDQLTLNQSYK